MFNSHLTLCNCAVNTADDNHKKDTKINYLSAQPMQPDTHIPYHYNFYNLILTAVADTGGMEHIGRELTGFGCVSEMVVAVRGVAAPCFSNICFFNWSSSSIFLFANSGNKQVGR